jgi:hypothetical protein
MVNTGSQQPSVTPDNIRSLWMVKQELTGGAQAPQG